MEQDPKRGSGRRYVPLLIVGLPLGLLTLLFIFVLAPIADVPTDAKSKAYAVVFAAIAILGSAAADYNALRQRTPGRPILLFGVEMRTITQEELRRIPALLGVAALALPLTVSAALRDEWFGFPLGFVIACMCTFGLMAYVQRESR